MSRSAVSNRVTPSAYTSVATLQTNGSTGSARSSVNSGLVGATPAVSLGGWWKAPTSNGAFQMLASVGANGAQYSVGINTSNFYFAGFNGVTNNAVTAYLASGQWVHVMMTYAGGANGAAIVYINGTAYSAGNVTANFTDGTFGIGTIAGSGTNVALNARFRDIVFYNRALSASEIKALMQNRTVPSSGLLRYYKCDEGLGSTLTDSSSTGDNATITSPVWVTDSPISPRRNVRDMGSCLYLNGANAQYADMGANAAYQCNSGSLECWVNIDSVQNNPQSSNYRIMNLGKTDANELADLFLNIGNTTNNFTFYQIKGGVSVLNLSTPINSLTVGKWQHIVATWDTTGANVYINGALAVNQSGNLALTLPATPQLYLARYIASTYNATGYFDEPALYSRALTLAEVQARYYKGIYPSSGVVAYWKLDEGSGTSLADGSGNGHTGTLNVGTWSSNVFLKARTSVPQFQNLIPYSEQFDQWPNLTNCTITANAVANPRNGAMTADALIDNTTNGAHDCRTSSVIPVTQGCYYTVSMNIKSAKAGTPVAFMSGNSNMVAGASGVYFDLVGGTATQDGGLSSTATFGMTSLGNGWYQCWITFIATKTNSSGNIHVQSCSAVGSPSYAGDGTAALYLDAAQVVESNRIGPYTVTTASAVNTGALRNTP